MPLLTCDNCGTEFDTDRDAPTQGADTTRCPSCGASHVSPVEGDGGGLAETVTVPADVEALEITLTVQFKRE